MTKLVALRWIVRDGVLRVTLQHHIQRRFKLSSDQWRGACWAVAVSEVIRGLLSLTMAITGLVFGPFSLQVPNSLWYAGEVSQLISAIIEIHISLLLIVGLSIGSSTLLRVWVCIIYY